jgi:response regulator NasT
MGALRVVVSAPSAEARRKICAILATAGCVVTGETDNGPGALRMIQALQPEVAIIDIDSPQGLAAAKMLEEDGQMALVLVGTHPRRENRQVVSGQIMKPINEAALLTAVEFASAGQLRVRKMADEVARLRETVATRKAVERAKGILMETLQITEADAYRRIQQQSMNRRVSLRQIAEAIITAQEFKK